MSRRKTMVALLVGGFLLTTGVERLISQERGGGRGPGRGGGADRRRAMTQERIKQMLSPSDEEWKKLQPKIDKVQKLSGQVGARARWRVLYPERPGGPPQPPEAEKPTPVATGLRDLRAAVDNKAAKDEEVKGKLAAVRKALGEAKTKLAKAQEELRKGLTVRQQAVLVLWGVID